MVENRVAVVTGAGSGIGRAIAMNFAADGAKMMLVDCSEKGLNETAALIKESVPQAQFELCVADVSHEDEVAAYMKSANEKFGRIDILVNNAGVDGVFVPTEELKLEDYMRVVNTNQVGVFLGMKHVLPYMIAQEYGRIVNIASTAGIRGYQWAADYVSTKHAVIGLTKVVARDYARQGIRCNAVGPCSTLTPLVTNYFQTVADGDEELYQQLLEEDAQHIPMGRQAYPEEIAQTVAFLASDKCGNVNGVFLLSDGGDCI